MTDKDAIIKLNKCIKTVKRINNMLEDLGVRHERERIKRKGQTDTNQEST